MVRNSPIKSAVAILAMVILIDKFAPKILGLSYTSSFAIPASAPAAPVPVALNRNVFGDDDGSGEATASDIEWWHAVQDAASQGFSMLQEATGTGSAILEDAVGKGLALHDDLAEVLNREELVLYNRTIEAV
eukprot:6647689-Prymnesium_polylepis.1